MNDDEINMLIARSEEEERRFGQMDIERERETASRWKAAGNRGKPPLPLMQLEELPDCYRTDEPFENKDELEEVEGRGQRKRNVVNYNDGLSDDQWAMVSAFPLSFFVGSLLMGYFLILIRLSRRERTFMSLRSVLGRRKTVGRPSCVSRSLASPRRPRKVVVVAGRVKPRLPSKTLIPLRTASGSVIRSSRCRSRLLYRTTKRRSVIRCVYPSCTVSFTN